MERRAIGLVALAMSAGVYALAAKAHDVTPVREGLDAASIKLCARAPSRPTDAPPARQVGTIELDAALIHMCAYADHTAEHALCPPSSPPTEACRRALVGAEPDFVVVHEAVRQDRALIGVARRARVRTMQGEWTICAPEWFGFEHFELASVQMLSNDGQIDDALERCADVFAVARDVAVAGSLGDVQHVREQLGPAPSICGAVVDASSHEQAARFASSLGAIRRAFPTSLEANNELLRAEFDLDQYGFARDRTRALKCARADQLVGLDDYRDRVLTLQRRSDARSMWDRDRSWTNPNYPKSLADYRAWLSELDRLIDRAEHR